MVGPVHFLALLRKHILYTHIPSSKLLFNTSWKYIYTSLLSIGFTLNSHHILHWVFLNIPVNSRFCFPFLYPMWNIFDNILAPVSNVWCKQLAFLMQSNLIFWKVFLFIGNFLGASLNKQIFCQYYIY